ncbi:MAG: SIS domain-containing protein [Gemmatimonadota bacterium]|nr:SIS domain-containing protein [Gemmatimonadota bacterium]MDH3427112.1 SIS domain-containing protein [Gemmatimonadota bacterium]
MTHADARIGAMQHFERLALAAEQTAERLGPDIATYADWALTTLRAGGRLFFCGNGGSAATAEHVATEYVVRFRRSRSALPAIALTGSTGMLTASGNDFGFEEIFVRPLLALARSDDLLVIHSTSGGSPNVLAVARAAARIPVRTVALVGAAGGPLADIADHSIHVPSSETATIQELHLAVEHAVADHVDAWFASETRPS